MQLHLILLSLTVAVALAAIVASPGLARRRLPSIFRSAGPFFLGGVLLTLTMSARGAPTIEWLLPMAMAALVWLFCTSESILSYARTALLLLAGVLIGNFIGLTGHHGEYTANPVMTASYLKAVRRKADIQPLWHTPLTHLHKVERR